MKEEKSKSLFLPSNPPDKNAGFSKGMNLLKIMVVGDEIILATDLKNTLDQMGFSVTSMMTTGKEAIESAQREKPDVVLMDINLHGQMDCVEAAAQIFKRFQIPVILFTASAHDESVRRAKAAGAFGYLTKPFDFRRLIATVELAISKAKSEVRLKENEKRYHALVDLAGDAVFVHDLKGHLLYVNQRACEQLGYSREELLKMSILDVERGRKSLKAIWDKLPADLPITLDSVHERKDGSMFHVEACLRQMDSEEGGVVFYLARNTTERMRAAEAQMEIQAQDMQADKQKSLNVMAGSIAHNFNNLLTVIQGNMYLALKELPTRSTVREFLEEADKAIKRSTELCTQMLTYVGPNKIRFQNISISEIMAGMAQMLEITVPKRITLKLELGPPSVLFKGESASIRQVITKLVINAAEAIGDNEGSIVLTTGKMFCDRPYFKQLIIREQLIEGHYAYFEVMDTGCGMDQETLVKVFDPYFTTKFIGRGLGMSAVLGMVRAHNGAIFLSSEPEKGTRVRVLFPLLEAQQRIRNKTKKKWEMKAHPA